MRLFHGSPGFTPLRRGCAGLAMGMVLVLAPTAFAQSEFGGNAGVPEGVQVLRVEEDWIMVLNEPDYNTDAPQLHTMMSPYPEIGSFFGQISWNYRDQPEYRSGGMQMSLWNDDQFLARRNLEWARLDTVAETVTWTQVLDLDSGYVYFRVENGSSVTWGAFGGALTTVSALYDLADLNGYSPDVSAENACVTFGANRVDLLALVNVRYYDANGLVGEDSEMRVVHAADGVNP